LGGRERRVPIAEKDIKLLWGRAGGVCSNPDCRERVAVTNATGQSFLTGEMAHIIARQAHGPRGNGEGGADTYQNLILLCPNCHTKVDKTPGDYPVDLLLKWKGDHERWVDGWSMSRRMGTTSELMMFISDLLTENNYYFRSYGPRSDIAGSNPVSSAHAIWTARRLDTILPNNRKILQAIEINPDLIPGEMAGDILLFRDHAVGYEQNQYGRLDHYRLFPASFSESVERWKNNDQRHK
jgi:hypothetical protein